MHIAPPRTDVLLTYRLPGQFAGFPQVRDASSRHPEHPAHLLVSEQVVVISFRREDGGLLRVPEGLL